MENIISYLISPSFSGWLLIFKILFIVFGLILIGFIIFVLVKTTWLRRLILWDLQEFLTYRPYGVLRIAKQWAKTLARLETGMESEYKLAVIEADSLLYEILNKMGFSGETLGEKLDKLTTVSLPNLEDIREAHKIRNNIVHDPDYRLSLEEARKILAIYEKALSDLQAL